MPVVSCLNVLFDRFKVWVWKEAKTHDAMEKETKVVLRCTSLFKMKKFKSLLKNILFKIYPCDTEVPAFKETPIYVQGFVKRNYKPL